MAVFTVNLSHWTFIHVLFQKFSEKYEERIQSWKSWRTQMTTAKSRWNSTEISMLSFSLTRWKCHFDEFHVDVIHREVDYLWKLKLHSGQLSGRFAHFEPKWSNKSFERHSSWQRGQVFLWYGQLDWWFCSKEINRELWIVKCYDHLQM